MGKPGRCRERVHARQGAVVSVCRGASGSRQGSLDRARARAVVSMGMQGRGASGSRQGSLYLRLGRALRALRNASLVGLQEDRSVDIDLAADARAVPLFE